MIIKNINTSTPAMTIESAAATLMCDIMISMFIKKLKIPSLPDLIPISLSLLTYVMIIYYLNIPEPVMHITVLQINDTFESVVRDSHL